MSGSTSTTSFPVIMTAQGAQPTPTATLLSTLLTSVSATNPGYTASLPGSLVEDISSTDVAAVALCNQFQVDLVNSLTPFGANEFLLTQLGNIYGVQQGQGSNTSVYVVFTGTPGFVIAQGFTVSDGSYQYTVQDGGIVGASGVSTSLYCLATTAGTWAVPVNTVTQIVTSVPGSITLTVTNPSTGVPGAAAQTYEDYRAQVLQAGLVAAQGMPAYMKTMLGNVAGVQPRLVSLRQANGGWEVICGGGDPFQVAYAIFTSLFDINTLVGSLIAVSGVTNANPGVVTTNLNHGLTTGETIIITGATGMTTINGVAYTATVLSPTTFSIGVNTASYGTYTGNGVLSPNTRNVSVTITDYPDSYTIPFVNPPMQTVTVAVTWNTSISNFTQQTAVVQAVQPAIINYINSIPVGNPINQFELQAVFQAAVANIIPIAQLTRMVFSVNINGVGVSPESGTGIIAGDPESYFEVAVGSVTVTQG